MYSLLKIKPLYLVHDYYRVILEQKRIFKKEESLRPEGIYSERKRA